MSAAITADTICRGSEQWVQTGDGLIGGYIDSIAQDQDGPIIIEYKTGEIFKDDVGTESGLAGVRDDYLIQVNLYAGLFYETWHRWPSTLLIVSGSGDVIKVPCDHDHCLELIRQAKKDLAATNCIIRKYYANQAIVASTLVSPSPKACRYCGYRPGCRYYWDEKDEFPNLEWSCDLKGYLEEVFELGNGKQLIKISTKNHGDRKLSIRGLDNLRNVVSGLIGQEIAIYDLLKENNKGNYKAGLLTTVYY